MPECSTHCELLVSTKENKNKKIKLFWKSLNPSQSFTMEAQNHHKNYKFYL